MANSQNEKDESFETLRELIKDVRFAMFTTRDTDDKLHSRPMTTQQTEVFDGELWFMTYNDSTVTSQVKGNADVLITYSEPDAHSYVSVNGRADVRQDPAKVKELWKAPLKAWFPDGPDDPKIALIRVVVASAEYWDSPSAPVQALHFLKAIATGKEMDLGDHGKLKLM